MRFTVCKNFTCTLRTTQYLELQIRVLFKTESMHSSAKLESLPIFFCSCDMVHNKQEVGFLYLFLYYM